MIIGWLYPFREFCGIAIYSRNYIAHLKHFVSIKEFNLDEWLTKRQSMIEQLNHCDIIHIQYEPSFFFSGYKNFFNLLIRSIKKPVIISLHEVYRTFPGVYNKDFINGGTFTYGIKKIIYDFRHPLQTAFRKHCSENFNSNYLLVHQHFHKDILIDLHCKPKTIFIAPHPIIQSNNDFHWKHSKSSMITFGSTGFINPNFNFSLLFSFLDNLTYDWKFIWIGGIRLKEHEPILAHVRKEISNRKWNTRFIITGWVSDQTQTEILSTIDIYLALFLNRSSSGSIARALGAKRLIIATKNELTMEINSYSDIHPLVLVSPTVKDISDKTSELLKNKHFRADYIKSVNILILKYSFKNMANSLARFYSQINKASIDVNYLPEVIQE